MRRTPPSAWALLGPAGLLTALLSSFAGSGCGQVTEGGEADDGTLRGELAAYTSDDLEGRSETQYFLRDRDGLEQRLLFDALIRAEDLQPNTQVHVFGRPTADGFHVTHVETPEAEIERVTSALRNATPLPARSFAFVLLNMGGTPAINTTADAVMGRLITAPDSIRNYYLSDSYGVTDVTAQVFGPIDYTMTGCGTSALATALKPMIPGTFQHYLWYFGSRQSACSWTGLASVGSPDKPSLHTWYNASTSCVVLVQEPGHNFGMQHSSSLSCTGGATLTDDLAGCTASEYGDPFDPMGGGCRHMNAWQKDYQGWFGGCNGVNVTSSGTFTILPLEQRCDGVQFLKIPAPKLRSFNRPAAGGGGATVEAFSHYYVELRTPQDFDGMLGNRSALASQVLVHIGGDRRTRTQRGLHTFLLDMTPATTGTSAGRSDSALGVGKSFADPAGGMTITVMAVSATSATINVDIPGGAGGPTCLDATPFTAPGPGQESCSANMTGAGGATGTAGTTGMGAAGTTGAAGRVGTAGTTGGAAGTTGAAGRVGTAGTTGGIVTGAAGATGAGGTEGGPGAAGATGVVTGVAGTTGANPTGVAGTGPGQTPDPITGHGCGCEAAGSNPMGGALATGLVALALTLGRRRRLAGRVRASSPPTSSFRLRPRR